MGILVLSVSPAYTLWFFYISYPVHSVSMPSGMTLYRLQSNMTAVLHRVTKPLQTKHTTYYSKRHKNFTFHCNISHLFFFQSQPYVGNMFLEIRTIHAEYNHKLYPHQIILVLSKHNTP